MIAYIYTFGKKCITSPNSIPIEVGAALRDNFLFSLHDNTGDNISTENPYYGELTGMYWVWKNTIIKDEEVIGFSHYNKRLNISREKAIKWVEKNHGMITLKPSKIRNHPVPDEVFSTIQILKETDEKYYNAWYKLYDNEATAIEDSCRGANIFITSGKIFHEYCNWLFPILAELRKRVGDKPDVNLYWRRYCAFMGERLLSVYIEANQLSNLGVDIKLKRWWIPYLGFIRRHLHISQDNTISIFLSKYLGNNSQYGKR